MTWPGINHCFLNLDKYTILNNHKISRTIGVFGLFSYEGCKFVMVSWSMDNLVSGFAKVELLELLNE